MAAVLDQAKRATRVVKETMAAAAQHRSHEDRDEAELLAEFYATVGGRPTAAEVARVHRQFAAGAFPHRDLRKTSA